LEQLVAHFTPVLDFMAYDKEYHESHIHTYKLECFTAILAATPTDEVGNRLRDYLANKGLTQSLLDYIVNHFPLEKKKDSDEWLAALSLPALQHVLLILTGLVKGYAPAQEAIGKAGLAKHLHRLECVASASAAIGTLAENVLAELEQHP